MDDPSAQTLAATQTVAPQHPAPKRDGPPPGANPHTWNLLLECRALANLSSMALQDVLAVAPTRLAPRVVSAMEEAAATAGVPGRGRVVRVRAAGAQVLR